MLPRLRLPDCVTILFCEVVSGWASGEKFASLNHTCQTIHLYSSLRHGEVFAKQWTFFWRGGRDLSRYNKRADNNNRLTANTTHIVEGKAWLCRKWPLFLCQHLLPETMPRPFQCGGLRHGCRTNKVCREFSSKPNRGRWSIKNSQRQMTSPSKMEHIKHLCGYSVFLFFLTARSFWVKLFFTHSCTYNIVTMPGEFPPVQLHVLDSQQGEVPCSRTRELILMMFAWCFIS